MAGNTGLELDQLWYTWSTAGLGAMPMGFRVRAASEGFHAHEMQNIRYRRVSRLLGYEPPEGASVSEFNSRIAPISFSFVHNGDERLLIRKVFTGQDALGRNGVFFTHLIAGLPRDFSARDAIRLWYCPDLWVDSEQGLSPNETHLEKIPYSRILNYVQHSQTSFNFGQASDKLQNLLVLILSQGLPPHITMRGHSTLIAALIYGLTHTLPRQLLPNLTFTTYESDTQESEVLIAGTINGDELHDLTRLQVQPEQATRPVSEDIQRYVSVAVTSLVSNNTEKLYKLIDEIERRENPSVEDLIVLFKRRFRFGELTLKQLEDIVLHPADNVEDLLDPAFQMEVAQLLLTNPDYWEQRGKETFQKVSSWLAPGAKTKLNKQTQDALQTCFNGMAEHIISTMQTELAQGKFLRQSVMILEVIAHPSTHPELYQQMLTEFAREPLYRQIVTDGLWPFHFWMLSCAKLMQAQPSREHMAPWLSIPTWDKLDRVLKLGLPAEWEYTAMFELLMLKREIPRSAIPIVKTHKAKYTAFMRDGLQAASQMKNEVYINMVLSLFKAIIIFDEQAIKNNTPDYTFPNRVTLLLSLLNAVPNDPGVIEALFAIVPYKTPYQLTVQEFDRVIAGCSPEVLAARSASPSLMTYLQEFILTLTPKQLMYTNTLTLLRQFQQSNAPAGQPDSIARAVNAWLVIHRFLTSKVFDEELLQNVRLALEYLVPRLKERGQNIWQTFIEELAPHLVALINTEYQLESVLYIFEGAHVVSSWDLLNALAACAGATLAEDLSRLIPYLLCGIHKYDLTKQPQAELDAYLQTLFKQASDNALKDVDIAVSARVWPDSIRAEWKGWRDRTKTSWIDSLLLPGKKPNPQQPKQPTGEQPSLKLPLWLQNLPATEQPQVPTKQQLPLPQVPKTTSLPKQAGDASPQPTISLGENSASSQKPQSATGSGLQISVIIGERLYPIHVNSYEQLNHTWLQILPYWTHMLNDRLAKGRSKGITSELSITMLLQDELKRLPATTISPMLVEYLIDNTLIELEIERIGQTKNQPYLNSANYIAGRLKEFKNFVGVNYYHDLCKNVTEQAVKDTLQRLIRRYHLIQHMEENKRDWNKWLDKERKSAKYKYHNVQART
ncbi:MAG TPA: hypothetical protein VFQ36_11460 [Ktedonobacteraceae bacterium]|nr:hypothetical protein [Ktedonobacteraceae bacterium]